MYDYLTVERNEPIAVVTLDRPPVNALSFAVLDELSRAMRSLDEERSLRVVILTGKGEKAFAAGADIAELAVLQTAVEAKVAARTGQALTRQIERMHLPVIAAINGFALGGGCELAMACDIRVASRSAKLGQPEVNLGIMPGYGGSQRTLRLAGRAQAMYLCLTGDLVDADEALRIGLVNRVVPPSDLMEEAHRIAATIASKGPLAISACKRAIDAGANLSLDDALEVEADEFAKLIESDDFKEGTSAFLEKRAPRFRGR